MGKHRNRNENGSEWNSNNNNNYHNGGNNNNNRNSNNNHHAKTCKYCGKNNHTSDNCHFKDRQPNQSGKNASQQNTKSKHDPKKTCNYCGKKGHIEADCRQKQNGNQQNNKQPYNPRQFCTFCNKPGHIEDDCMRKNDNNAQPFNPKEYCIDCKRQGHIEIFCPNKQKKKDDHSKSKNEKEPFRRPVQGNTPGQYGNPVAFELPLGIVRREIIADRGFFHGVEWTVPGQEHFVIDVENDVLMCDCDGSFTGCLSACAHNLFSQKGTMWISKEDKHTLERSMWTNRSTRAEDMHVSGQDDFIS